VTVYTDTPREIRSTLGAQQTPEGAASLLAMVACEVPSQRSGLLLAAGFVLGDLDAVGVLTSMPDAEADDQHARCRGRRPARPWLLGPGAVVVSAGP